MGKKKLIEVLKDKYPEIDEKKLLSFIMGHRVLVNEAVISKKGYLISEDAEVRFKKDTLNEFVTRAQEKLQFALGTFEINVDQKTVVDVGASMGGFSQCLINRGAKHVHAVDVAYGIFDWRLRNDKRITVIERKNARTLNTDDVNGPKDVIVVDVSFISVTSLFEGLFSLLKEDGILLCLIKPQFESSKETIGGIIQEPDIHAKIIRKVIEKAELTGFFGTGITESPILGRKGNREFFVEFRKNSDAKRIKDDEISEITHKEM